MGSIREKSNIHHQNDELASHNMKAQNAQISTRKILFFFFQNFTSDKTKLVTIRTKSILNKIINTYSYIFF